MMATTCCLFQPPFAAQAQHFLPPEIRAVLPTVASATPENHRGLPATGEFADLSFPWLRNLFTRLMDLGAPGCEEDTSNAIGIDIPRRRRGCALGWRHEGASACRDAARSNARPLLRWGRAALPGQEEAGAGDFSGLVLVAPVGRSGTRGRSRFTRLSPASLRTSAPPGLAACPVYAGVRLQMESVG